MNLENTIVEGNDESLEDRSKAMIFVRRHRDEALKSQYLTVEDPFSLWSDLKDRYDHQKTVILPRTRHEWMNLRLQDFKTVSEYNSELFWIVSRLRLCGEVVNEYDLLENTCSTFHASNVLLQQQYRERRFEKYSQLISCLLVAEQNNELLMRNHQSHLTGTVATPEVNASSSHGRGKGHWHGPKRHNNKKKGGHNDGKRGNNNNLPQNKSKGNGLQNKPKENKETTCFRCGMQGHWPHVCRTAKHLVDLYQASLKTQGNNVEMNFVNFENGETTHFDISDFLLQENNNES
ncbi:uncharacterized protein LOC113296310 [Papaver somniferum]|uniref:uncharacterized protein LOC113296310 n=1 Tax=Papaver somniferum TaxID=3469 RepID=UPI000E6FF84C|nr:uncharacterized protein LOC113296310 [Papaver somniferum]